MSPSDVVETLGLDGLLETLTHLKKETLVYNNVRRKARYHCFRLRTYAETQQPSIEELGVPFKLIEFYESQSGFKGWNNFGVSWDIGKIENILTIVKRDFSIHEEWESILRSVVPELGSNEVSLRDIYSNK